MKMNGSMEEERAMNEILNMSIEEMGTADFDCSCGKHHHMNIQKLIMGKGVLPKVKDIAEPFRIGKILLVSDENTFQAAGEKVLRILEQDHFQVKNLILTSQGEILIPNEEIIGRVMLNLDQDVALIIGVGSGSINDTVKYISSRTDIPYVIVCTAPSMDGYVADGAPLILDGRKISFEATLPYGVLGDTEIMKHAPQRLIQAGFGDVLGKMTALTDWKLANELNGDYYCQTCVTLVERALKKVIDHVDGLKKREDEAILYLIEALNLTGVAMGLIGISRPASGAEHMLSHFWEMDFIARGKFPELHGIKVGIATPIIAEIFQQMKDELPEDIQQDLPDSQWCKDLLERVGAPASPKEIGIEKSLFYNSILNAYTVRNRYSILQLAVEKEKIKSIAQNLVCQFYE